MEALSLDDLPHAHAIKIIGVVPLHENNSPCSVSRRPLTSVMATTMMSRDYKARDYNFFEL
jgi:hypothetical protein